MALKKTIISIAFLLTYSLGLAHEFIPHCHHNEVGQHSQRLSQLNSTFHEKHCATAHHEIVEASLSNFIHTIIGFMSESEHPATCSELALYLPSIAHDLNPLQLIKLFIATSVLCVFLFSFRLIKSLKYSDYEPPVYTPPPLFGANLRGPPSFSC